MLLSAMERAGAEDMPEDADYYLNRSGMVDMPEEWKAGIFLPRFGLHIANTEHGVFTDYGYLVKSGDEWQRVHEGQPVPEEYRVMAYPAPEIFPLLCSVLIGMIGYILNLIFPNFEWENVTHIIKQSLPAILTALIGVVVTCGTAYLLLRFFPSALFMGSWLACAIILLLLLTMVAWVDKKGQHLYQEL